MINSLVEWRVKGLGKLDFRNWIVSTCAKLIRHRTGNSRVLRGNFYVNIFAYLLSSAAQLKRWVKKQCERPRSRRAPKRTKSNNVLVKLPTILAVTC